MKDIIDGELLGVIFFTTALVVFCTAIYLVDKIQSLTKTEETIDMKRFKEIHLQHKKDAELINYIESLRAENRRLRAEKKQLIEQMDKVIECNNELCGKLRAAEFEAQHPALFTVPATK